jgi:4-alpha-glucanotransferase
MHPVRLLFGVHLHQPVGNFDHVFAQHVDEVYLPFLRALEDRDLLPVALHVSGPLLEWLEHHDRRYLDLVGRLVTDGRLELLLAGFYEPILSAIPRPDRAEQIGWMRDALRRLFGAEARALWLTERVWEPELVADLADAGVESVLVDDRHFLVSGFERNQLYAPYRTESDGRAVAVFPIDERLRYLIPFKPPADTAAHVRALRERGHTLAVFADDGEKFGGWPGTREWVYERGWLREFGDMLNELRARGELVLATPAQALREVPSAGLAYLPTASYREMEGWALWPQASRRLRLLETELGEQRLGGPEGGLIRGAHWRNFLAKYPESNRMHKKMVRLSALSRARGEPAGVRRAIARGQCNDAYWHGVFGGLYLPHLREALWHELATAESILRAGEPLRADTLDFDCDGHIELWVHSAAFSALVSPHRGATVEEYTSLGTRRNYADVLTRRREAYHEAAAPEDERRHDTESTPSTHELERGFQGLPPTDRDLRALFLDRVLAANLTESAFAAGMYDSVASWGGTPFRHELGEDGAGITIACTPRDGGGLLAKRLHFAADGALRVDYTWAPDAYPEDAWFTTELGLTRQLVIDTDPAAEAWTYPINTMAKSERGFEETLQGLATVLRWPVRAARATVLLRLEEAEARESGSSS